ncbi:MAG: hypothetical protein EBZ91_09040 [Gammaproteobacteria bacterium]|nr:hypothetical protein [Gammaproteobacteria bacterium]
MSEAPIMAPTAGPDQPLALANVSQLVAVALRLAMEVSTLRERLRTQQLLLEQAGVLAPGAVEGFIPQGEELQVRLAADRELIEALASDLRTQG